MAVYPQEWRGMFPMIQYPQLSTFPHFTQFPVFNGATGLPAYYGGLNSSHVMAGNPPKPVYIMIQQRPNVNHSAPLPSTHLQGIPMSMSTPSYMPSISAPSPAPAHVHLTPPGHVSSSSSTSSFSSAPLAPSSAPAHLHLTPLGDVSSSSSTSSFSPAPLASSPSPAHLHLTPPGHVSSSTSALSSSSAPLAPSSASSAPVSGSVPVPSIKNNCHRVIIQGSKVNYIGQNASGLQSYTPSKSPPLMKKVLFTSDAESTVISVKDYGAEPSTAQKTSQTVQPVEKCHTENHMDFSNLNLLSTVSLSQPVMRQKHDTPKTIHNNVPPISQSGSSTRGDISDTQSSSESHAHQSSASETESLSISSISAGHALALQLVPATMIRKPTVWLNVTLQVDTSGEIKGTQQGVQYRSLITNIVTELFYPPQLCPPDDVVEDEITATASYDERGRLTVLQVEFITPGIYKVDTDSDTGKRTPVGKPSTRSVTLTRMDSLESLVPKSQYFILGDLCPVPRTFQRCHRNAQTLYKKLTEYLYSREFRKYTLPLLLKHGEEDVWTSCLKVPRTRSRVSDYDDLAVGQQSLKRKSSSDSERSLSPDVTKSLLPAKRRKKIYRTSSVSSVHSVNSDSTSIASSPCTSPTPSLTSFPSIDSEESCDSLVSNSSASSFIPISPPKLRKATDKCLYPNNICSSPPRLRPQNLRRKAVKLCNSI